MQTKTSKRFALAMGLLAGVFLGCGGTAPELPPAPRAAEPLASQQTGPPPATPPPSAPAPSPPPPGLGVGEEELPGPGELCPDARCHDSAICIGGICHRKCTQSTVPSCNDVVRSCTADEVCLPATSFTDACFPATARTGEPCGADAAGAICRAGNLCVRTAASTPARCLKLCKYGCADQCVETEGGCPVCL